MDPIPGPRPARFLCSLLVGGVFAAIGPGAVAAQVGTPDEALEEIRSLAVQVDVSGSGARAVAPRALEVVIRQELERVGILERLGEPRGRDCCVLRLDVRVISGAARSRAGGGATAFSARLELGQHDQLGRVQTWVVYWAGRTLDDFVAPGDLADQLRFTARELAVEFVDQYLVLYPIG
jgi:hypothetical protein